MSSSLELEFERKRVTPQWWGCSGGVTLDGLFKPAGEGAVRGAFLALEGGGKLLHRRGSRGIGHGFAQGDQPATRQATMDVRAGGALEILKGGFNRLDARDVCHTNMAVDLV